MTLAVSSMSMLLNEAYPRCQITVSLSCIWMSISQFTPVTKQKGIVRVESAQNQEKMAVAADGKLVACNYPSARYNYKRNCAHAYSSARHFNTDGGVKIWQAVYSNDQIQVRLGAPSLALCRGVDFHHKT